MQVKQNKSIFFILIAGMAVAQRGGAGGAPAREISEKRGHRLINFFVGFYFVPIM